MSVFFSADTALVSGGGWCFSRTLVLLKLRTKNWQTNVQTCPDLGRRHCLLPGPVKHVSNQPVKGLKIKRSFIGTFFLFSTSNGSPSFKISHSVFYCRPREEAECVSSERFWYGCWWQPCNARSQQGPGPHTEVIYW